MPIDPDDAVTVARRHGLGLSDAASLAGLADSLDHAERLAAQFGGPPTADTVKSFDRTQSRPEESETE